MSNPAKVKVNVTNNNPQVCFYKDGSADVQSSLVNVVNEFKMKKYIQGSSQLEDVMTVNEDGAVKFHKNVTFAGDSVIQNVQTVLLQDQKVEVGLTNSNQVETSSVVKSAGFNRTTYSVDTTSNINSTKTLLIAKNDTTNGPGYTSASFSDAIGTLSNSDFEIFNGSVRSTIDFAPIDSTNVSDLKFYHEGSSISPAITDFQIVTDVVNLTFNNQAELSSINVGDIVKIATNGGGYNVITALNDNYGIVTLINGSVLTIKYTGLNQTISSQLNTNNYISTYLFQPVATLSSIDTALTTDTYKFTATDTNTDFSSIYNVGDYLYFSGVNHTANGTTSEVFNTSNYVSAVGTTYVTVENAGNYTVANLSGSAAYASKLANIADNTGLCLVGQSSGDFVKAGLNFDNSTNHNLQLENDSGAITIGGDSQSHSVNIATQGNRAITIGNSSAGAIAVNTGAGFNVTANANSGISTTSSNINLSTSTTGDVTVNAVDNVSITAGNTDDTTVTSGQVLVYANDDVADAILLKADNGASQTIKVQNENGTGNDAIQLHADAGGVEIKVADGKEAIMGNADSDAYVKVSANGTAANEKVEIKNTNGTAVDAISFVAVAGGIKHTVADEKALVLGNTDEDTFFKVNASATPANEQLHVKNTSGDGNDAIKLDAVAGGIEATVADEKTLVLGNTGKDTYFKVSASATAANEQVEVKNTSGDSNDAIKLDAVAGGIEATVADEKTLVLGNAGKDTYFKVSASATAASEQVEVKNTSGDGNDAIKLDAVAGGIEATVADEKTLVLGNTDKDVYYKVSASGTASDEKMEMKNTNGTGSDAIKMDASAGGITLNAGDDFTLDTVNDIGINSSAGIINMGTDNNGGAINIGTQGNRTITVGLDGTGTIILDSEDVRLTNGVSATSDARLKENYEEFVKPDEMINNLHGIYYTWKKDAGTNKPRKIGFLAQEVEKVIPELVKTDNEGMKSVDYIGVIPVLVEALKNQQQQIDDLKKKLGM